MRSEVFDAFRIIFGPKRVGQQLVDGFRIAIPVGNLIQVDRSRKRLGGHRKGTRRAFSWRDNWGSDRLKIRGSGAFMKNFRILVIKVHAGAWRSPWGHCMPKTQVSATRGRVDHSFLDDGNRYMTLCICSETWIRTSAMRALAII